MFFQRGYVLCVSKVFVQDFQSTCKLSRNKPCGRENSTCSAVVGSPTGMNKKIVTSYQTVSLHTKQLLYAYDTIGRFLSCTFFTSQFRNQFKTPTPSTRSQSGQPTGICHRCLGHKEFNTKQLPMNGEFYSCLGGVGNFNCKFQVHVVIPGMKKLKCT